MKRVIRFESLKIIYVYIIIYTAHLSLKESVIISVYSNHLYTIVFTVFSYVAASPAGLALPCIATFGITVHTATRRLFYEFAAQKEALHGGQHDEMAIGFGLKDFSFGFGFGFLPATRRTWLGLAACSICKCSAALFYAVFQNCFQCPFVPLSRCPRRSCRSGFVFVHRPQSQLCIAACRLLPGQRLDGSCCVARKI